MKELLQGEYLSGVFIEELKNRFLCSVMIDSRKETCYVPSSCHLSNFLELKGRNVLLVQNKSKDARTRFSLFAVPYKRSYIVLNTSMANQAIERNIKSRRFAFLGVRKHVEREYQYFDYKCDFFVEDTNTIIEVKSVIDTKDVAMFPTLYSERSILQLQQLKRFLQEGIQVVYCIVSLHPYTKKMALKQDTQWFRELRMCMNFGLQLKAYTSRLNRDVLGIDKEIEILL